jgi:hypothetical protein
MRSETLLTLTTFKQVDMFKPAYCHIANQPQNDKSVRHAFHSNLSFMSKVMSHIHTIK